MKEKIRDIFLLIACLAACFCGIMLIINNGLMKQTISGLSVSEESFNELKDQVEAANNNFEEQSAKSLEQIQDLEREIDITKARVEAFLEAQRR